MGRGSLLLVLWAAAAAAEEVVDVVIVGAGWAGMSAARSLVAGGVEDIRIFEATDHVGGRTRNMDVRDGRMDTTSDHVVEVGGTFVSPGHTALIAMAADLGFPVYNVTAPHRRARVGEPAGAWPWWSFSGVFFNLPP